MRYFILLVSLNLAAACCVYANTTEKGIEQLALETRQQSIPSSEPELDEYGLDKSLPDNEWLVQRKAQLMNKQATPIDTTQQVENESLDEWEDNFRKKLYAEAGVPLPNAPTPIVAGGQPESPIQSTIKFNTNNLSEDEWVAEQMANKPPTVQVPSNEANLPTNLDYGRVLLDLISQQLGGAIIIFPLVWLVMRKKGIYKYNVTYKRLITGFVATGVGAGVIQYILIFIVGGKTVISPEDGWKVVFSVVLPLLVAILISIYLRLKSTSQSDKKTSKKSQLDMNALYEIFAKELQGEGKYEGFWLQALDKNGFDESKAKSTYIELRINHEKNKAEARLQEKNNISE